MKRELLYALNKGELGSINLLLKDSDINEIDKDGRSLLHHAVLLKDSEVVDLLINKGASLDIQDNLGWSPLHFAAQRYDVHISKTLIDANADLNSVDNYGNSVLWRAVFESKGRGDVIKLLISSGADIYQKNNKGVSPINLAQTIANYKILDFFT